jgi:methylated-DNA-protein-cysteine methyltransferase-like protein
VDIYKRIGIVCRHIPEGRVATYGQIALLCGKPQNSRQVGYGLKKGLAGDHLPAHRVVNSRGILSGASYFDTFDMQKMLLESEGVQVIWTQEGWRVNLKDFGWNNTIGDAVYLKSLFEQAEKGENSEGTEPGHKEQTV